ncbi:DMT family transporter [Desulfogranum japonicum]|uniref:DMT family transporter n=1 Tax=Desulfogranum japonicum TaxID=231447 RepID=UPI000685DC70
MLCCAFLVSTSFTVGKAIAADLDPAYITFLRFLMAVLLFLPIVYRQQGLKIPPVRSLLGYSLISGTLVGFFYLMFLSLRYTTALHTGVIYTLVPSISGLYSAIILREHLGITRIAAIFPAMFGATWVVFKGHPLDILTLHLNQGDLIFLGGCLIMALYTPLIRLFHKGETMAVMTFWILVCGCGWLLLLTGHNILTFPWQNISVKVLLGIAYLAIFTTIITFFINQWATLYLGPTRVMAYSYLYPPLIAGIDWSLGHGLPSAQTMLGILFIVPAMFILQKGNVTYKETTHRGDE